MIVRNWLWCALWLSACSPGHTYELGRLVDAGDRDAESDEDARVYEPCERNSDCGEARPWCDEGRELCVECLGERHCGDDEWCSQRGRCISER